VGMLIGHGMRSDAPQVQSMPATQKSKWIMDFLVCVISHTP
jgi:hypothetical protein